MNYFKNKQRKRIILDNIKNKNIKIIDFKNFITKEIDNFDFSNIDLYLNVYLYSKSILKIIITSFSKK